MRKSGFYLVYALLLIVQMVISNYFHLTPYVMLSILPVMVLCLPIRIPPVGTMVIAFVTGLLVDLLSEGLLGINALALVPVAFARNGILRMIFGGELFARNEDFSASRNGFGKVAVAILIAQAIFLAVYVWADSAGTRPGWFNALRFGASLAAGFAVSLIVVEPLAPDTRK